MNRQTYLAKNNEVEQQWWVVDATDQPLGRLSAKIAMILMGKTKPTYTPHHDVGDFVIVINAEKVTLTGNKSKQKFAQSYSGYSGGLKQVSYAWMLEHKPEQLVEDAVRRMLPKNKLGKVQHAKLKVYQGSEHPHQAQQPEPLLAG